MALETRCQTKVEEDFKTSQTSPSLLVPTLMLKQASERYTHAIFNLFSDEYKAHLIYTIEERDVDGLIFRYKMGQEGRKKSIIMIDSSNIQVGCTGNKFEFAGIICRHIVKVLYHRNINEIPSKYILARWTKDVNAGIVRDEVGKTILVNCNVSLSLPYNELCAQAIKITTKGAINEEVYTVVMRVLKNELEEVELAAGLKEILTVAQGCERGRPPRTRLKSGLELSQKRKKSKTTRTDSSNSNVRKYHTSPQKKEDLRQCDTMLTEATCTEKNVYLNKSNERKHPTSPQQNEVLALRKNKGLTMSPVLSYEHLGLTMSLILSYEPLALTVCPLLSYEQLALTMGLLFSYETFALMMSALLSCEPLALTMSILLSYEPLALTRGPLFSYEPLALTMILLLAYESLALTMSPLLPYEPLALVITLLFS
ncbi:hypothetical protein GIB67_007813 [Kingdonia uniflora]|uniref:Protein FAR1-RELATED SEQUENCE n=1 Tax=Kingdonia uniflora TaxID=39325 RepID=A0A7J7N2C1_9MAGN|nr:hypothetical protein GIB67_007813 [Kingdonia uniflora]